MRQNKNALPKIFAGTTLFLTAWILWISWKSPLARAFQRMQPVFGLIVGTDWVDNARHADTIILARYDPSLRSLDLLSVPRDTRDAQ